MALDIKPLHFPNESHFRVLLQHCNESSGRVIFHEPAREIKADHAQLLQDIYTARQALLTALPRSAVSDKEIIHEESSFVCVLAQGGYEFVVASFAILAIGGAVVPLAPGILPEEALHLMKKCQSTALLAGSSMFEHSTDIQTYAASRNYVIKVVPITIGSHHEVIASIGHDMIIHPDRPSMLLFTSGTSGPPKGVVHTRRLLDLEYRRPVNEAFLNGPSIWTTSAFRVIRHTFYGRHVEIIPSDPKNLWERFRQGRVAFLAAVPPVWQGLMDYFQQNLDHLPLKQRDEYIRGIQDLRVAVVTGGTLHSSRIRFWRDIGKPITLCYGATELGRVCLMTGKESDPGLSNCLGRPTPKVIIKLSQGDHGELLIKSPAVFSHYLGDLEATRASFTSDGFYKTGDLARRVGEDYVFGGRASIDFIKYHWYKVPAVELEMYLNEVPGLSEAYILPVQDERCGYRAAALVRLSPGAAVKTTEAGLSTFNLQYLRSQLSEKIASFMLPTALRVLKPSEAVPMTVSGKIIRREAAKRFFSPSGNGSVFPEEVEVWLSKPSMCQPGKAWDWAAAPM